MTNLHVIQGGKGDEPRTPVEAPNTLKSVAIARVLDLVSEGEIRGLANGMKSIFLDETPIENPDGTLNFKNIAVDWRHGTQTQDYIAGYPSVENELGVGVELRDDAPYIRAFSNINLNAVRIRLSTPALSKTNKENGDVGAHSVAYSIDVSTDDGPYVTALTSAFTGKTMSKYERDHRIDLPPSTTGWQIRIRRTTPKANVSEIQDLTYVESMVEIIDAKLRYPNSALIAVSLDASQFQNVPSRAYDLYGRIIRVPANYDPETRTYATTGTGTSNGVWDGTFKLAWTDNPAWIYYDLCTNKRYGLGHIITDQMINKWHLYRIAKYSDQMVPDGHGGLEPRFTCNLYLQRQNEAYKVIQDLATAFRGIAYWANGEIMAVSDMPEDPVYTYTPANVIEGKFAYQGSGGKVRHTVALVSWNDMNNFGRSCVEYVDDPEGIARYGLKQMDMTAIGCTSQGQAQRFGRYALATGQLETQTVSFSVGLDGTLVAPGKVIRIADPLRAGRRMGGRISSVPDASTIIVDGTSPEVTVGDTLTIIKADGVAETRQISQITGNAVTVSPPFSEVPRAETVWAIDRTILNTQRYRVISVTEGDTPNTFVISAIQHVEGKFDFVDNNTIIDLPPTSLLAAPTQSPPTAVVLSHFESAGQVNTSTVVTVSWLPAPNAVAYDVEWRRDDSEWTKLPRTSVTTVDIRDAWAGTYQARVRAVNTNNIISNATLSQVYVVGDQTMLPGFVADLQQDLLASMETLPNFVSREELVEITQHMLTLGTIAYEEAEVSAGAKYDVARAMLDLQAIDAKIVANEVSIADNTQALAQTTSALGARIDDAEALILNEQTARTTADTALASDITALQATVDDVQAEALSETTARVDGDTAITNTLDLIGAKSGDGLAFILATGTVKVSPTETLATRLSTINTTTGDLQTQITNEQTARTNADTAIATDMALLGAKNSGGSAWILDMTKVKVDSTTSLGVRLSSIDSRIGTAESSITNEQTARVNGDNAIASDVTSLSTTVGNHTTTISTHTNSINGLSAQYTVKVDNNGYVSGFGLASTAVNGTPTSTFTVLADKFQVVSPGNTAVSPFTVTGGVVYMTNVVIQNAQIQSLSTGKLVDGTLNATMTMGSGKIIWDNGTYMKVTGMGFGSANQFIEWFGPKMAITSCTEANAIQYLKTNGSAYFGGALSAGTLFNSRQTTDTAVPSEVSIGPYDTNGNAKTVTVSYTFTATGTRTGTGPSVLGSGNTATVLVYQKIGTGSEVLVQTMNLTGSMSYQSDFETGTSSYQATISGSYTMTDNVAGTAQRTYRAQVSARTYQSISGGASGTDALSQKITVTSTEQ